MRTFFTKDGPAINEHRYHINKKQYNEDIQNIYYIDKSKSYNIKNHIYIYIYTDDHYYIKKQFINNSIINNIIKKNIINSNEHVLNLKKDYLYKTYITNSYKSQIAYVENNLYKKHDSRTFNNT